MDHMHVGLVVYLVMSCLEVQLSGVVSHGIHDLGGSLKGHISCSLLSLYVEYFISPNHIST